MNQLEISSSLVPYGTIDGVSIKNKKNLFTDQFTCHFNLVLNTSMN